MDNVINEGTLMKVRILSGINSLTTEEVEVFWSTLLGIVNGYNDEIQYNENEINDTTLLQVLLVEYIKLQKQNLWGDTLNQTKDNFQRYLNTVTGLGI